MRSLRQRFLSDPLEALAAASAMLVFRLLPVDAASALGGFMARAIGPALGLSRRATKNLQRVFPDMSDDEVRRTVRGMWDNLGRTVAEFPHLAAFDPYTDASRVEVVNAEQVDRMRDDGKPGLFYTGHLGNWEISSLGVTRRGLPIHIAYRAANNPLVDWLIRRSRGRLSDELFAKGAAGARHALAALKENQHVAMVVDQKMNDGIPVPFLGVEAMTAPALAQLALRHGCPVVPVRVERLRGAHFRLTFYPPHDHPASGDRQADVAAMMAAVNEVLGGWIRERPEQWLWLHNRWPSE